MGYSVEKSTSSAWSTLFYAMGYNLGMLVVVALSYSVAYRWRLWWSMLAPRNAVGERGAFPKDFKSLWRTVKGVLGATEQEIIKVCGVDSAVYVRFLSFCLQLFMILLCTVFPLLMATYSQGANPDGVTGINQLSLSNVLNKSGAMWVTTAMLYFITLLVFYLIWRHTIHVLELRRQFFFSKKRAKAPHNYATVVMCIPPPPPEKKADPPEDQSDAKDANADESLTTGQKQKKEKKRRRPIRDGMAFAAAMTPRDILESILELWTFMCQVFSSCLCGCGIRKRTPSLSGWITTADLRPLSKDAPHPQQMHRDGTDKDRDGTDSQIHGTDSQRDGTDTAATGAAAGEDSSAGQATAHAEGEQGYTSTGVAKGKEKEGDGKEEKALVGLEYSSAQEYAMPGEPVCPPYIVNFFQSLFGDQLLHLQPVYRESSVAKAYTRWRHAIRMLNESRMRWERAMRQVSEQEEAEKKGKGEKGKKRGNGRRGRGLLRRRGGAGAKDRESGAEEDGQGTGKEEMDLQEGEDEVINGFVDGKSNVASDVSQLPLKPIDLIPKHKINKKWWFFGGEVVESIPYWIEEVKSAAEHLQKTQAKALQDPVPSAVIAIFKTHSAASLCREALRSSGHWTWKGMQASPVQEMWWDNLRFEAMEGRARTFWATIFTIIMVIFFYIPVTLIASLASGQALSTAIGAQKEEVQQTWMPPFLQSIVPSLALHSVLWIFSPVFMLIGRWEGRISLSDAMIVSSSRFYYVVVVNVFIAYNLTSSLFQELFNVLNHSTTILELFATSIPGNAAFYIQYTLNSSLMCGMELGRLPIHICCYLVKYVLIGKEFSDRERHWDQGPMAYHVFIGYQNLIITFGIVYAVIAPLILPFTMLFLCIGFFTWKHELMHSYKDPEDRGGVYWLRLMHHVLNAVIIAQITTVGMLGIKLAYTQMGVAALSFVITLIFYHWLSTEYGPLFEMEPLDMVAEKKDTLAEEEQMLKEDPRKLANYFYPAFMKQPVMPNLDPLAPSDPDIWHHMHPKRHLFVRERYYPTPPVHSNQPGAVEGGKTALVPRDASEAAFWELNDVKWVKVEDPQLQEHSDLSRDEAERGVGQDNSPQS